MSLSAILEDTPVNIDNRSSRLWKPKQVLFTPAALEQPFGQQIYERVSKLQLPVELLKSNRLTGIRGESERETYQLAKQTMAVVVAPPSAFRLQPIPPSADFQFHLAEGCPAHCQYCYLAGSLQGPPVVRVFANLPSILDNTFAYHKPGKRTTFEASCYTDPLSIEHLTGSLSASIRHFGSQKNAQLRWVTKYSQVDSLLDLPHFGNTRCRISLNAEVVAKRLEGGTASISARLAALRKLALPHSQGGGSYPVGIVLAPIMPIPDWQMHYIDLLNRIQETLEFDCDLTFELISHRFTPGSKDVLLEWYPNTSLDMNEANRSVKYNKFGGQKFVYSADTMKNLRKFFENQLALRFPKAPILYWT
ncbi:radical SAM protein [Rhodocytophaga aerolata]|uniref:Radical SAM protein n=1 Tax=Rhodocytophaga aerolata TaxID=455078 RepID=A0ABT8RHG2_9BACT|nr:radical SAM protein [Rhodocytophaga aerolata]MDO1450608.1 radical SAM protein [Rhodocytophaga aerolata]